MDADDLYTGPETEAEAAAAKEARDTELRDQKDLRDMLATPFGRRFLWRLLSRTHLFATSFSTDPLCMAHQEGERRIGLEVLAWMTDADPKGFAKLMADYQ